MIKVTDEIKDSLKSTKIAFLSTAAKDGSPNVVPIGAFKFLDDETLLISDQFFNKTLKNLQENPKIALAWWGNQGGFQIKADITIHTDDEIFRQNVEWVQSIKESLQPKSAIVGKITGVYIVKSGPDAGKKIL
ncbi:MAG TPA: pyridoxamine 5'-phosphate oxidase family protein [Smithellaceae bacterium]|jgi:predicted pyridoxine 5'-phosphate oxidase superfamily flavin-nucleotide-binding protein|nr:flavin-nucleotide-binding protein [Smithella sp.]HOG82915.1 pyridoxamine 5'-phosphate oxidase family protein [Smithellaceae bacterium]HOQ42245.1 pyridoxamine 5'-phosphate oxidase family protein [Smithellaceae bacterium]HPL67491.1 pyridoxamine 5'-phosphate oxidase family protein [Smithellaceae bacterium]HRY34360.1 pyridoxamine 5'-phosphate oxidase family protein [Smithellaceae bacterium]